LINIYCKTVQKACTTTKYSNIYTCKEVGTVFKTYLLCYFAHYFATSCICSHSQRWANMLEIKLISTYSPWCKKILVGLLILSREHKITWNLSTEQLFCKYARSNAQKIKF